MAFTTLFENETVSRTPRLMRVKEVEQNFHELKEEYSTKYGGKRLTELDKEGSLLLLDCLEAKKLYKSLIIEEWKYARYHEPVLNHQIMEVKNHISHLEFKQRRGA